MPVGPSRVDDVGELHSTILCLDFSGWGNNPATTTFHDHGPEGLDIYLSFIDRVATLVTGGISAPAVVVISYVNVAIIAV